MTFQNLADLTKPTDIDKNKMPLLQRHCDKLVKKCCLIKMFKNGYCTRQLKVT